ncbi:MAG: GNAT family N-acetyltransferase [Burkholderiaceae bacterium]
MALAEDGFGLLPVVEVAPEVLASFRCGKAHLDIFLAESADLHRDRLALTTVVFHIELPDRVVGYFTLANDSLPLTTSEQEELGVNASILLKSYPAVKLCRLGVAREFQGRGIGKQIMGLVHGEILESASLSAARLVTLDADNTPDVIGFYTRLGYQTSLWAERKVRDSGPKKIAPQATVKIIRDILAPA